MNLADFLLERIAEDEAVAAEAGGELWEIADPRKVRWTRNGGNAHGWVAFADLPTATEHIARHDPARVLAECEAKRGLLRHLWVVGVGTHDRLDHCDRCQVIRYFGEVYADHPDYDPAWRP